MIEKHRLPEWGVGDTIKSIRDIARVALNGFVDKIDTTYANQINTTEDES